MGACACVYVCMYVRMYEERRIVNNALYFALEGYFILVALILLYCDIREAKGGHCYPFVSLIEELLRMLCGSHV